VSPSRKLLALPCILSPRFSVNRLDQEESCFSCFGNWRSSRQQCRFPMLSAILDYASD
jgi:hypothetical protein